MKYFIIAGEASGDLHASNLMRELKVLDREAQFQFLGGDLMQEQGGEMIQHYENMAFMGFWNVLKNAKKVIQNLNNAKESIKDFKPDVLILIDYPSFNLRIARFVKKQLKLPVFYYIPPKLWAWKEFRIKSIKRYVDKVFTIFPFETEFYQKHNYAVQYVGNPTVDTIVNSLKQHEGDKEFRQKNSLNEKNIIALLPGSRKQEVSACLPKMIDAAKEFEQYQLVVAGSPGNEAEFYSDYMPDGVKLLFNQTYELLSHASVAIVNSGTATLETALIKTPQLVVYHVPFSKLLLKIKPYIIKTKFISLVNILAQKEVVKELLGHHFNRENLINELDELLNNKHYRQQMLDDYTAIQNELGRMDAAQRAATAIYASLKNQ